MKKQFWTCGSPFLPAFGGNGFIVEVGEDVHDHKSFFEPKCHRQQEDMRCHYDFLCVLRLGWGDAGWVCYLDKGNSIALYRHTWVYLKTKSDYPRFTNRGIQ